MPETEATPAATIAPVEAGVRPEVHTRDDETFWTCPACEQENALTESACARCHSPFTSFFGGAAPAREPRASGRTGVWLSGLLPGLGHWIHREAAPAAARAVLYVWTISIGVLLLVWPPAGGRAIVRGVGTVFVLSAAAIWVLSLLETMRLDEGDPTPMIPPKTLTWVSAGLSGLLMFGLLVAAISGR